MSRLVVVASMLVGCWSSSSPEPAKPAEPQPVVVKQPVKDIVQPVKIEKVEEDDPCGDPCGVQGGVVGGVSGGVVGGVVGAPPPPPPPPPPPGVPQNVAPTMLEANRIAGNKYIVPDDKTKTAIQQSGKTKIVGAWKLCLADTGAVTIVTPLKSTGFPDYDRKIQTEMSTNWKYSPYQVNGRAVPVCTAITFIYAQSAPTPPPPSKTP